MTLARQKNIPIVDQTPAPSGIHVGADAEEADLEPTSGQNTVEPTSGQHTMDPTNGHDARFAAVKSGVFELDPQDLTNASSTGTRNVLQ